MAFTKASMALLLSVLLGLKRILSSKESMVNWIRPGELMEIGFGHWSRSSTNLTK